MFTLKDRDSDEEGDSYGYYAFLLVISAFLDVISHTIKEALVRSQPLN